MQRAANDGARGEEGIVEPMQQPMKSQLTMELMVEPSASWGAADGAWTADDKNRCSDSDVWRKLEKKKGTGPLEGPGGP